MLVYGEAYNSFHCQGNTHWLTHNNMLLRFSMHDFDANELSTVEAEYSRFV